MRRVASANEQNVDENVEKFIQSASSYFIQSAQNLLGQANNSWCYYSGFVEAAYVLVSLQVHETKFQNTGSLFRY